MWRVHLEEIRKTEVSCDGRFQESSFWKRQERWFQNHLHHGLPIRRLNADRMLGPLMTPFGHWLFVGWGLVGGIGALCELFHLVVAFGCCFLVGFFFALFPGVAGKGWWWEDTAFTASLRHWPVYLLKQQTSSMPGEQWQRAVPEWDETVCLLKRPPTSPERV